VRLALAVGSDEVDSGAEPRRELEENARKILIVDDNEDAAGLLGTTLRAMGHEVLVASNGIEALRLAEDYVADVALLDLSMPVMDGYELAQLLRGLRGWSEVRLIAVTGYGQASDLERSRAAGFETHLVKPIDVEAIDQRVRTSQDRC
jgi:CheY-like chemotaxis protein